MIAALCLSLAVAAPPASPPASPRPARPRVSSGGITAESPIASEQGPQEALVETSEGSFVVLLLSDLAPRHVLHFVKTARSGGYDGTTFHRVIPRGIIQGGDPLSKDPAKKALYGTGGLGLLKAELSSRPMSRGAVAAVLQPGKPDSGGSQFFVVLSDQPSLTGKFTIFGEVASGLEVADAIGNTPVTGETPDKRIVIRKVTIRKVVAEPTTTAPSPLPSPPPVPPQ
jgi:cyclophilin family peptidyl-prolyl cis-trans isomerase